MKMHDFLINITNDTKSNENPILKSRDQKKHKGFYTNNDENRRSNIIFKGCKIWLS